MNWKSLLLGAGLGFAAGYAVANKLQQGSHVPAEKALKMAKELFEDKGEITGSWIHMVPEVLEKFDLTYEVYRGGVTALADGVQERFEFLADAKTGTILEVTQS
ncbi:PepSY domain-containing protein [Ectobacillus panaciterrae]|uniref:PepSY domain-containing protein n=1 Tax=Ectobacillus panaciterrae TaxID=363872 RepID=UPI000423FF01|nr:PepSY domain-containing protein [Ectobacillus panaciterrae]